jgi:hypothetical protein
MPATKGSPLLISPGLADYPCNMPQDGLDLDVSQWLLGPMEQMVQEASKTFFKQEDPIRFSNRGACDEI